MDEAETQGLVWSSYDGYIMSNEYNEQGAVDNLVARKIPVQMMVAEEYINPMLKEELARRERKYAKGGMTFDLEPSDRKSFYGKAKVITKGGINYLQSYSTIVAEYNPTTKEMKIYDYYSPTTARHINAFLDYYGYPSMSKSDILANKNKSFAKGGKIDYSKRTPKDFKLGELVYDTRNKTYGTIIGIYDNSSWEVRLDSDGMQPTEYLRKLGEDGDKGTKKQLFEGVASIERLIKMYPENNYPKLINNPFYGKGGNVKFRKLAKGKNFDIITDEGRFEIEMGAFGMPKNIIVDGTRKDINTNPIAKKYRAEIQDYLDANYEKGGKVEKKENNEMIIGGLAGILLGIFLNK